MSKELILKMSISVDGFVAGPNGELDWIFRSMSDAGRERITELLSNASYHALGHRSYQEMAGFWSSSQIPMANHMNEIPKLVASHSGKVTPPDLQKTSDNEAAVESWLNPTVIGTDLVAEIQRLKSEDGKPILAHGGASFASSLIAANVVDVFHLVVHPDALGRGLPIFHGLEKPLQLKLESVNHYDTGVVAKIYRPM